MRHLPGLLLLLAACDTNTSSEDVSEGEDTTGKEDDSEVVTTNPYGDGAGCPLLTEGTNSFDSAGLSREVIIKLPDDPEGAPVVFVWHWLGGTADQILSWMEMDQLADEGAIVVAPQSTGMGSEWDYVADAEQSIDVILLDDLLVCLWETHRIDANRVYTTGMSAGGLFTTYLTMFRSDVFAASLPFSGGVNSAYYTTPEDQIPVMLVWGGTSDTYGSFSFHEANLDFSEDLRNDGHFVVECMHSSGHVFPTGSAEMAWTFFESHARDDESEAWSSELPSSLPSYCVIP